MSKSLNISHLDIFQRISIRYNEFKTFVYFSLELYNNNDNWCCRPLVVNPFIEKCNSVYMKKMQTIIKFIENQYLNWNYQLQGEIKISPFEFCPCLENENFSILKWFPFMNLTLWKLIREPPIVTITIHKPWISITSTCK